MPYFHTLFAAALLALCSAAAASEIRAGQMLISRSHAKPTHPGQTNGAAYVDIANSGRTADRLISVSTPIAAGASLHLTEVDGAIVKMREADGLDIAPGAAVRMTPGSGYHIMLTRLKSPLKSGDRFTMTLTFGKTGKVDVPVTVDGPQAAASSSPGHGH